MLPALPCARGKPFKRLCRGKERARLKIASDCPWSLGKGRAKAFSCSTARSHTLGAAFLAEPGHGDSDRGNIWCAGSLHQPQGDGKVHERLSSPCKVLLMWGSRSATATPFACHLHVSTLPALPHVLSLPGFVAGCLVRSSARQTHPRPQAR